MSTFESGRNERIGWVAIALLGMVVAFLGGSSRPDAVQLIALRPLAGLFLIAAFYFSSRAGFAPVRPLLALFGLFAGWMAIQLIPLPPALWQMLSGREAVTALDSAVGLEGVWRPVSMVPSRGMNALASLVVPAAGLLLAAALGVRARTLLLAIVMIGALDGIVAVVQIGGGGGGELYFYSITNRNAPVGLFANQNHSAVFSALSLVIVAHLATDDDLAFRHSWMRAGLGGLFLFLLMVALVGESRAGLLATVLALAASGFLMWQYVATRRLSKSKRSRSGGRSRRRALAINPKWLLAIAFIVVAALVVAFVALDRSPAFAAIAERGQFENIRWQILPVLGDMAATYWIVGSGFGSFEEVYHIFEPDTLMLPSYINQAHNDWAQLVIEGGLPAVTIAFAALAGFVRGLAAIASSPDVPIGRLVFWLTVMTIIMTASLVDYPMRTPIFQLVAVWLALVFVRERDPPPTDHG